MPRHKDVPQHSSNDFVSQLKAGYSQGWLRLLAAITCSALLTLACGFTGSSFHTGPGRIVIRRHLPTLTRTPPPIFTPLADTPAPEVARVTEPTSANPSQAVSPIEMPTSVKFFFIPTFTPVSAVAIEPVEIANNNVPATPVEIAAANPSSLATTTELPPTNTPAPTSTPTPVPLPTETPLPTSTPTETPIPLPAGWVFSGVRPVSISGGRYLMVPGILFNNTGTTQTLNEIKRIFPGDPEQTSAGSYRSYYPVPQVSQGGWIPFKLLIPDPDTAEDFELEAVGNEGGDGPRQQFELLDVNASTEKGKYCVAGKVRNSGDPLNTYLVVAAVLYDSEDKVINYNDYDLDSPQIMAGDQKEVNICVDSLGQEVARYELQAWGL